ncbi:hypothetical protein DFP72DRAFT_116287 [Ephemerocybe angulata]|uniref:F-box domain-containing protein n=1 Tax=Ephemerocybe angulata TaxID=980116 RepID=A0A8H6I8E4_9AGAR|nr:hypothetical protein DFP72DRAFT_116287 [Tulosesus angulatus]
MGSETAPGSPGLPRDIPRPVFSVATQELLDEDIGQDLSAQDLMVQRRIQELEREISALKSRQNILRCPLNRMLPPELLLRIFLLHPTTSGKSKRVHLSHVCGLWRSIALESGAFWSDLLFTTTEMTELMLNRSKEALLTARCHRLNWRHREIIATILSQRGRLHTFEISGPVDILPPFDPARPQTAPFVQSLSLTKISIPVWKGLPLGPSVTELRLDCPKVTNRPTMNELFGSLLEMPLLRILHLSHLLPKTTPSRTNWTKQPLSLENLKELRLRDTLKRVNHFIKSVDISYFATVFVDINDATITLQSLDTLIDVLGVSWSLDEDEPCRWYDEDSEVQEISVENFTFSGVHSIHRPSVAMSFCAETVPDFTISFPNNDHSGDDVTTFLAVLDVKLNLTETLLYTTIDSCDALDDSFWPQLGSSVNLETLTFTKSPAYQDFFIYWRMVAEGKAFIGDYPDEVVLLEEHFPSLSTIRIVECDLGPRLDYGGLIAITDYLETRTDASNTDLTLEINECRNFDKENFNQIEGSYTKTEVDWDYDEDMSEDEFDRVDSPSDSDEFFM